MNADVSRYRKRIFYFRPIINLLFILPFLRNAVESPIRSAFEKIKTVMQRVPDHDLEEDFARTPASGNSSSGVVRAEAAGTVTAEQSNDGANPQASELPSTAAAATSSSSKANYPARARYHRKRFSIEDATFKPWRSPSPKKKLVDEDWKGKHFKIA